MLSVATNAGSGAGAAAWETRRLEDLVHAMAG
jgi:hypothetical protein